VKLIVIEILVYIVFISVFIPLCYVSTEGSTASTLIEFHSSFWNTSNWVYVEGGNDFWEWSRQGLTSQIFAEGSSDQSVVYDNAQVSISFDKSDFSFTDSPVIVPGTDMTLVGAVRFRQLRVVNSPCASSYIYSSVSTNCARIFNSGSNENRGSFYSDDCPSYLKGAYTWSGSDGVSSLNGNLSGISYPPEGFVFDLPPDESQSLQILSDLEANYWIDSLTAGVIVEVNTYHPSVDFFVTDRFLFEFSETGSVYSSLKTIAFPLRLAYFSPSSSIPLLLLDLVNLTMYVICLAWTAYLILSLKMRILKFRWTQFDIILLIVLTVYVAFRISIYVTTSTVIVGDGVFDQPREFYPLSAVQSELEAIDICQTIALALLLLRSFKIISLFTRKFMFVATESFSNFLGITCVAVVGIVGIGFARHTALAYLNPLYAQISKSILCVALSLTGAVWVQEYSGIGGILSLVIVVFLYLIIVPIMISLSVDSVKKYDAFRSNKKEVSMRNPLFVFISTAVSSWRGREMIEDLDDPSKNGVEMNVLPGIITKRIIAKRKALLHRFEIEYNMVVNEFDEYAEWVNYKELARLMEQDQFICKILGSNDPKEVMQRFGCNVNASDQLQLSIDRKLDRLNKMVVDLKIQMNPLIGELSDELDSVITDCRVRLDRDMRPLVEVIRTLEDSIGSLQASSPMVRKKSEGATNQ
jgi:hypothetical protein